MFENERRPLSGAQCAVKEEKSCSKNWDGIIEEKCCLVENIIGCACLFRIEAIEGDEDLRWNLA
jgi:hypothetical protein